MAHSLLVGFPCMSEFTCSTTDQLSHLNIGQVRQDHDCHFTHHTADQLSVRFSTASNKTRASALPQNNPCQQMVFFLKDTSASDLAAIIEFMYKGSVNVAQTQLASFIKTAEMLQIRGLSGDDDKVRWGGVQGMTG